MKADSPIDRKPTRIRFAEDGNGWVLTHYMTIDGKDYIIDSHFNHGKKTTIHDKVKRLIEKESEKNHKPSGCSNRNEV